MANSKYEYVKSFERDDILLPNTWIVVRIDGRGFHKFSARYGFEKPNDLRALNLMNAAAKEVMKDLSDLVMAYGSSDEFSFVFHRTCQLFERRSSKLVSTVVSTFTAHYVYNWPQFFPSSPLEGEWLPTFDSRAIQYPSLQNLRDYMSWRQVDCHINNLYNTTFWNMVLRGGMSNVDAESALQGTVSSDKNELLFSRFGINYNNEPEIFRKGSVLYRDFEQKQLEQIQKERQNAVPKESRSDKPNKEQPELSKTQREQQKKLQKKAGIAVVHVDIVRDEFWERRPWIVSNKPGKLPET
ncbi:tRNA-His guanylyltransferase [Ophidiomyces ophidiicola]|uniref:tRNA-His guanylyltransferase n=1 Tax=Ophidiomyces ophidiicola TaxID=1387563 RepID=A0ACB8V5X4_9EURO|nr:tRNA-His guanylyltransferase [Ophidiomyces ophidiicola]KAI1955745.1 tRNA-His guanylyltransferase [Ophidiomyces ophidiicola]KAI1976041.1 tRNA-His guanylyltransferase [Ophidiomyces ophidiicola]KAI2011312.1 tRNA-His guanylyltransferase [Ophidiomyces ophidiicola]KAI2022665.1 tRNA-His guanylyltransferase [Ophidiomyces ophidiicola]